ncbi:MAG: transglycosylase SLT domain-containing protein [Bdellovibrionales bacterium]|nr:transglycosylase SLT domain-containing protein [Bdellovibrionales bacterium]
MLAIGLATVINFSYQIYDKPAEILSIIKWSSPKSLYETWSVYKNEFTDYSTDLMTPGFLAALAQVESGGDPLASPDWSLQLNRSYKKWFSPLSSSIGLFQFTESTFDRAKNFCIHKNRSVKKGKWYQLNRCAFNGFYLRVWPSHSIELTSSYLDHNVKELTKDSNLSLSEKQKVAAIIHLCGKSKASEFIQNGLRVRHQDRCGSHSVGRYLSKLKKYQRQIKTQMISYKTAL